jgi:YhcH/YjgK/YiaL family protein
MIYDSIKNLPLYRQDLQWLSNYIEQLDTNNFVTGQQDLGAADKYYPVNIAYTTKPESEGVWEAHRQYLDVHYMIEGTEFIAVSHIEAMTSTNQYDAEKDFQLFDGPEQMRYRMTAGQFLVLYPHEVHKTSIQAPSPENIKKIVFKILL